jgi:hypothetical protein
MEYCGNEVDSKNLRVWEKELSQCHFAHQKSHIDCPTIEFGSPRLKNENSLQLCLSITLFKRYWRNITVYNIYIMNLQIIIVHIGPLCTDQEKEDSKTFAGLFPTSMTQVLAPECGKGFD